MAEKDCILQFLKKLILYIKLVPETVHREFLSKFICAFFLLSSSIKVFFYNWNITLNFCFIDNLSENFHSSLVYAWLIIFIFLSNSNIWSHILYFVVSLIVAAFDTGMFFHVFVSSLNWDIALGNYEAINTTKLFQTRIQYWVYWITFILSQSHTTLAQHI